VPFDLDFFGIGQIIGGLPKSSGSNFFMALFPALPVDSYKTISNPHHLFAEFTLPANSISFGYSQMVSLLLPY